MVRQRQQAAVKSQLGFRERLQRLLAHVEDVLAAKHQDYGSSGLGRPALAPWLSPLEGLLTRQSDKYARLGQGLMSEGGLLVAESMMDTALDQLGYAVLIYLAVEDSYAASNLGRSETSGNTRYAGVSDGQGDASTEGGGCGSGGFDYSVSACSSCSCSCSCSQGGGCA